MPWGAVSTMDLEKEFIILQKSEKFTASELYEMYGISRPTITSKIFRTLK